MARFNIQKKDAKQISWKEALIERINEGKALPIISYLVDINLIFGNQDDLTEGWAFYTDYPSDDRNLAYMTQYLNVMAQAKGHDSEQIKRDYLTFLKEALQSIADADLVEELAEDANAGKLTFSETADRLHFPNFETGLDNPLLVLAKLPLPIYLTTSCHTFLQMALQREGKQPHTEICYWNNQLGRIPSAFSAPSDYHPSVAEPLVYHLHGLDAHPASLVLTEDDHLDFLVNTARDWEGVPLILRKALTDSALMLLGFGLTRWDFRTLFRGFIKTSLAERRPKSVAIQLQGDQTQQNYLQNYLDLEGKFEVYWGDAQHFMREIWQAWAR